MPSTINASTASGGGIISSADSSGVLELQTAGTTALTIATSGDIGIGVTPAAWQSNITALQIGSAGSIKYGGGQNMDITSNAYFNTNWIYITSATAERYELSGGQHVWYRAPSGTAGNPITFTQSMTLDPNGNLGIGTGSPQMPAHIQKASGNTYYRSQNNLGFADIGVDSAGTAIFYNNSNLPMTFGTNGLERMRLTSGGDFIVGATSGAGKVRIASSSNNYCLFITGYGNAIGYGIGMQTTTINGDPLAFFNISGTQVGSISTTATNTSYNTSSDYRLKENIAPMNGALAKVALLKPCTYTWKSSGEQSEGFIAHELQEVVPDCVTGEKDGMRTEQYEISPSIPATYDEEGNELTPAVEAVMGERQVPAYQGIDTSFLVATLTSAIQELKAIVDAQATRIEALESK
jgi:hypothetical protein